MTTPFGSFKDIAVAVGKLAPVIVIVLLFRLTAETVGGVGVGVGVGVGAGLGVVVVVGLDVGGVEFGSDELVHDIN